MLFSCPHGGGETAWQTESRASRSRLAAIQSNCRRRWKASKKHQEHPDAAQGCTEAAKARPDQHRIAYSETKAAQSGSAVQDIRRDR